jgi:hypothetical protein
MMRRFMMFVVVLIASLAAATADAQSVQLQRVMRTKLAHSQKILEAVVTSNWTELEQHARALEALTKDPAWAVLMTPEYATHTKEFVKATDDLINAAKTRDLDRAPAAYNTLTLSCVGCHRYVARSRIAR